MALFYTGVGSRRTPPDVLADMEDLARHLAARDLTLRSGHAEGADQAFEGGAGGRAEVFVPSARFQAKVPVSGERVLFGSLPQDVWKGAMRTVVHYHPAPWKLRGWSLDLIARDACELLGRGLDDPSGFVVCWCGRDADGCPMGGTGQVVRLAEGWGGEPGYGVPVFNYAEMGRDELWAAVDARVDALLADDAG